MSSTPAKKSAVSRMERLPTSAMDLPPMSTLSRCESTWIDGRELFSLEAARYFRWLRPFDVAPDGNSFLMVENSDDFPIVIVQNWIREFE